MKSQTFIEVILSTLFIVLRIAAVWSHRAAWASLALGVVFVVWLTIDYVSFEKRMRRS